MPKHAAGVIHVDPQGHVLLLKRAGVEGVDNFVGHWALPGGAGEEGEMPEATARRERREEIGFDGKEPLKLLDQVQTPNGMTFHTFVAPSDRFEPQLNHEHSDWAWAPIDMLPEPLHPSVQKTLSHIADGQKLHAWAKKKGDVAMDAATIAVGDLLVAALEPRELLACDRAPDGVELDRHGVTVKLAFDKESTQGKSTDNFERMHVKRVPITKACVNPYYGREIPKGRELGLDPNKVYWLLRDPEELRKSAATFHNIPLLSKHVPHSADDHDGDITVGTVGSEAEYEHPYLYNSLAIWSREGLHYAEGDQKELSSAYSYDADMTPGVYEGRRYDGVMRNMKGNHVCMVKKGRAGSDVALDEALKPTNEESTMKKIKSLKASIAYGAVRQHLSGVKLAQDAALPALQPLFAAVKPGAFNKKAVAAIGDGIKKGLQGKLAQDADLAGVVDGVQKLMSSIEGDTTVKDAEIGEEVDPIDPAAGGGEELDPDEPVMDGSCEEIAAYLKAKGVPDDIIAGMPGMAKDPAGAAPPAQDGPTDDMKARLEEGGAGKKDPITQQAMDAALEKTRKETIAQMNAVNDARRHVRPVVGEIEMAFDSAAGVYQQAFKMTGNTDAAKHADASVLKTMWDLANKSGARKEPLAQDGANDEGQTFADRFPNAAKRKRA